MARHLNTDTSASDFPWPRFTRKTVMLVAGVWTVSNALVACFMRSGYIPGTPAQLRRWALYVFVGGNLWFGFITVNLYLTFCLGKAIWYKKTGGFVPYPLEKATTRRDYLSSLIVAVTFVSWSVAAIFLETWLTPKIWPMQRGRANASMLAIILLTPLFVLLTWTVWKHRSGIVNWIRKEWSGASRPERALKVVLISWSLVISLVMFLSPRLQSLGWPLMLVFSMLALSVITLIQAGIAITTRRR